jgi:hypothetical protein
MSAAFSVIAIPVRVGGKVVVYEISSPTALQPSR